MVGDANINAPCPSKDCNEDKQKTVKLTCDIDKKENDIFVEEQRERNRKRNNRKKNKKPKYNVRNKTWKDDHCKNLLIDYETDPKLLKKRVEEFKEAIDDLKEDYQNILEDFASGALEDKAEKGLLVLGCGVVGGIIGGAIGFFGGFGVGAGPGAAGGVSLGLEVCGTAATVDTAIDVVEAASTVWNSKDIIKERIEHLKNVLEKMEEYKKNIEEIADLKEKCSKKILPKEECTKKMKEIKDKIYEDIETSISNDPCIKARRCQINSYTQEPDTEKPLDNHNKSRPMDKTFQLHKKHGCCPGQRAHHIIPETKLIHCPGYKKGGNIHTYAPTVCLEGGNGSGTHGEMHRNNDLKTTRLVNGKYPACKGQNINTIDCTIEVAAAAYVKTFNHCKKACIKKQLKDYYKGTFKNCNMPPVNTHGKPIKPEQEQEPTNRPGRT